MTVLSVVPANRLNMNEIRSEIGSPATNLFDFKWSDHILNDIQWLRADTFSWQSGLVYTTAYEHLVDDFDGTTSATETIGSYTITYYLAEDGHKIVLPDMEATVQNIYNESDVAWYYILDVDNQRFKLPRSGHGNIVEQYHNGTKWYRVYSDGWCEQGGKLVITTASISGGGYNTATLTFLKPFTECITYNVQAKHDRFNAGFSTEIYGQGLTQVQVYQVNDSSTSFANPYVIWQACGYISSVPDNAQYKYLYFYVGNYAQSAIEQTAGLNAELFNGKVDSDLSNMNASQTAKETIVNWGMPDYNAGVSISSGYTASKKGIIYCYGYYGGNGASGGGGYCWCKIGDSPNFIVAGGINSTEGKPRSTLPLYINAGETCTFGTVSEGNASGSVSATFYPLKGDE